MRYLVLLALAALAVALPILTAPRASEDMLALWLAASALAAERPDLVYAPAGEVFTMRPPEEAWLAVAAAIGHEGAVYPYLYPPIWAALVRPLTHWLSFATLETLATLLAPLALLATSWLAWRAFRPGLRATDFILTGQILFYATSIGALAVQQNQPQILVAFLLVLAIERSRADAQIASGAALALAAAIKLYPLLFAPILLARGQRRAFAAFLVTGAGLAAASVWLAGWPLHSEFLAGVASIAGTAIRIPAAYGLDTVLANLLPDAWMTTIPVASLAEGANGGWQVFAKPPAWTIATRVLLVTGIVLLWRRASRLPQERLPHTLWPVALIGFSLLIPLAWCYYFLAPLAFAPGLLASYGPRRGAALLLAILLPVSIPLIQVNRALLLMPPAAMPALGFAAMLALLIAFALQPAAQKGRTTLPE
ncbi:glycosyltransferase family 87 protein [Tropicimonas sp. IMCC6043]|uniref:glycosyltransferase family 87 protein n=1 Tax=Tropicimonas sp. IMCC6043 TaxID=2510645 RepID=UPI00101C0DA5|nr:glycosyltransferase family 87 protein [Tropicimonas sp. IMCC6043]RYH11790.1 DUF2029 domain-containing protein [Tropicimonas sp. IMCC6043]